MRFHSCFSAAGRSSNRGAVRRRSFQSARSTIPSRVAASCQIAYRPPRIPPMLVPAIISIGMRCSSRYRKTPMWDRPSAPPPLNAIPTVGLLDGVLGGLSCARMNAGGSKTRSPATTFAMQRRRSMPQSTSAGVVSWHWNAMWDAEAAYLKAKKRLPH